jgi:hypothetical protein
MQRRVQEGLGLFRVEVANQLRRAFEIGKEDGDLLTLAFQGAFGGEDLLGQIRWRVGERRLLGGLQGGGRGGGHRSGITSPD